METRIPVGSVAARLAGIEPFSTETVFDSMDFNSNVIYAKPEHVKNHGHKGIIGPHKGIIGLEYLQIKGPWAIQNAYGLIGPWSMGP